MEYTKRYRMLMGFLVWMGRIFHYKSAELKQVLSLINSHKKILDLGCNTGYLASVIQKKFPSAKVCGADINKDAIKYASKKYKNIEFFPIEKDFYKKHKFDCIIISHVLEHIPNPEEFIQNIKQILNPKGELIITIPQERVRGDAAIAQIILNLTKLTFENPHIHKINYEKCQKILNKNNFVLKQHKYINLIPPYKANKRHLHSFSLVVLAQLN